MKKLGYFKRSCLVLADFLYETLSVPFELKKFDGKKLNIIEKILHWVGNYSNYILMLLIESLPKESKKVKEALKYSKMLKQKEKIAFLKNEHDKNIVVRSLLLFTNGDKELANKAVCQASSYEEALKIILKSRKQNENSK